MFLGGEGGGSDSAGLAVSLPPFFLFKNMRTKMFCQNDSRFAHVSDMLSTNSNDFFAEKKRPDVRIANILTVFLLRRAL